MTIEDDQLAKLGEKVTGFHSPSPFNISTFMSTLRS